MAAKTLDQVLAELNPSYQPQLDTIRQRQSMIPGQVQEGETQLNAKQDQAFGDIVNGARRRGLGFSGIPISEQAKYTSTEFLPALARLRQSGQEQAFSLEDSINQILERRNTLAQNMVQQSQQQDLAERQFAEQQRQFNEQQRASQAGGFSPSYGGGGGGAGGGGQAQGATMQQRGDKGFNYIINGQPVSAAVYAHATGQGFRDVLQKAANAGDQGARTALGFVGNDYGYDANKVNSKSLADLYNALVWGTGKQASVNLPSGYGTGAYLKPASKASTPGAKYLPSLGMR